MSSSSPKTWWRRAAAAMKDKRSICLSRVAGGGQRGEMEAAVIRATSHDDRSVDYKNAARVFAWARTAPACLPPLMRALTRRARRTRSWVVALKTLLLAHGVLLCSAAAPGLGRLPFDLSDFRDRSTRHSSTSYGFSAFVRAYFQFLDHRSLLLFSSEDERDEAPRRSSTPDDDLKIVVKMQDLLDLLMQIRPYADGMEVGLILEAMDCVVIEIFEVYSNICSGIARFLVDVLGPSSSAASADERRLMGIGGMGILRRAAEQSEQLSSFFNLCRGLGVLNAAEIPAVETIPEDDIRDLESLVIGGGIGGIVAEAESKQIGTVVTDKWEVFEDETAPPASYCGNPFLIFEKAEKTAQSRTPWEASLNQQAGTFAGGDLIELI
ncbi:Putative clathrin assembly protein [Apostasia shenzhenica]|uniref:Clathrin assembly protein n=1 Tax=Apostasia shenzhenica TaxID=1088818 RepID=A0A2I0AEJ9_9ASPA|nr:Putative clathrin assembly protein [Apostasia shenzhenica]